MAAAIVATLLAGGGLVLAQTSRASETTATPPAAVAALFDPADPVYAAAIAEAQARAAADEAELASPAAQERREESADAFADLSDSEAVALVREAFPEAMTGPTEAVEQATPPGTEIAEFSSQFTAQLVAASGEPAGLLESTAPLTTGPNSDTPIDLSLSRDGADFVPADADVEVELPRQAADPALLEAAGIGLEPVSPDPSQAVKRGDRLIYPSIETDTDYILQPVERGVESFWQLRSAASPETVELAYDLPQGARLELQVAAGAADTVAIIKGETMIGIVHPVSAVDAAGRPVPAEMTVDGDKIVVAVAHRSDSVEYPVLVDPVTESWTNSEWSNCGAQSNGGAWTITEWWGVPTAGHFYHTCNWAWQGGYGMFISGWDANQYPAPGYGSNAGFMVSHWARDNTYISDITWGGWRHGNPNTHAFVGLAVTYGSHWQQLTWSYGNRSPADLSQHTDMAAQNRAVLGLYVPGPMTSSGGFTGVSWVSMWIRDGGPPETPTIAASTPALTASGNDYYFPWSDSAPSLSVRARDVGLGLWGVSVLKDDGTAIWGPHYFTNADQSVSDAPRCTGTRSNPCPWERTTPLKPFKNLSEGDNHGRIVAFDAEGKYTFGPRVHARFSPQANQAPMSTVDFSTSFSVASVRSAFLGIPDIEQIKLVGGGYVLAPDESVAEALGELDRTWPEWHGGQPPRVSGVVLAAPMITADVDARLAVFRSDTGFSLRYESTPAAPESVDAEPALGTTRSATVRQEKPWLPALGTVNAFVDSTKTLSQRVTMKVLWPLGSLQHYHRSILPDYAYEHDLKLFSNVPLGGKQTTCQNEERYFWARRGKGFSYDHDLPEDAEAYFDTHVGDPCEQMDLTVGVKYPKDLSESKHYTIHLYSRPPSSPLTNRYQLAAQRIARACPGNPKICGQTKTDKSNQELLIGSQSGARMPGCRSWRPGDPSLPC